MPNNELTLNKRVPTPASAILWRQLLKRYYVIIMIYTEAVLGQTCPFSVILPVFVFTSKEKEFSRARI
jgi:hypothetical protein